VIKKHICGIINLLIVSFNDRIYPVKAKAGINLQSNSLKVYSEKYKPYILSRMSLQNLEKDDNTCNYPLYAISLFPV